MAKNNYQLLIKKLDQFIRKFYINKLIRGVLYSIAIIVGLFLLFNLLESQFFFSTSVRKGLYYSFLGISTLSLLGWVFIPLAQYFRLGRVISHEQAAKIIGEHFTGVKDKLLNLLQLKQKANQVEDSDLLLASINQKSEDIKLVPFKKAINLGQNRKYLWYALPPLMLLLGVLFINANLITDSTTRLINNDKEFEREAPFHFKVSNENLSVIEHEDFLLNVEVEGEILPNEVFIDIDDYKYKLTQVEKNQFTYKFNNVQKETNFKLTSGGFDSENYELGVLRKPNILGFDVRLNYPSYTQRKNETLANIGDMVVPLGTNISWSFKTKNTDDISIQYANQKPKKIKQLNETAFRTGLKAMRDQGYKIYVSNKDLQNADSVNYSITVIPDLHPTINVQQFADSLDNTLMFFVGDASDDYGLNNLTFNYSLQKSGSSTAQLQSIPINASPTGKAVQYDYTWDVNELGLKPGDKLTYYFEVWDNDAINGRKSARTNVMNFAMPTIAEYQEQEDKNNEEINKKIDEAKKESKAIKDEMKRVREKLLQEKEIDWQTRKEIEKLLERQKNLEQQIESAKEDFQENLENQEEFSQPDEQLMEKQEKVQELFEELMSDEMKEMLKQLEELLQEMNKEDAMDELRNFEMGDEELSKELDRLQEMLKQLQLEKEMQDQIDKLEKLAEKQEKLSEDTEQNKDTQQNLEKRQEEINKEFDEVQENMDKMEEMNEDLENKKDMDGMQEEMENIDQDLQDSQENLDKKQNKKASQSQKNAAQKMQQMAKGMEMSMQAGEMDQMEEDMDALRQLLENLVTLSFEQEEVMGDIKKTAINTPKYTELVQGQYKIKDDFKLVEDSLQALSKRVYQIESFVTEKVTEIKEHIGTSLEELEERRKSPAAVHQQSSMKGLNDLALMLSEVMNQMQQSMASAMSGSQNCSKPGNKAGSKPGDKKGQGQGQSQEQLNKEMQKMLDAMKNGKGGKMSKEFAQMAKRQAAIRRALEKLQKERQEKGKGASKELQELIDEMNKTETNLVNKKLNNRTLKRQQDILTRLLEHEKAEREEEYDNKRKAERPQERERKMPPQLEEYIKKREAEIDMYKSVSPALKPYYKFLVEEYFKKLKSK